MDSTERQTVQMHTDVQIQEDRYKADMLRPIQEDRYETDMLRHDMQQLTLTDAETDG